MTICACIHQVDLVLIQAFLLVHKLHEQVRAVVLSAIRGLRFLFVHFVSEFEDRLLEGFHLEWGAALGVEGLLGEVEGLFLELRRCSLLCRIQDLEVGGEVRGRGRVEVVVHEVVRRYAHKRRVEGSIEMINLHALC